MFMKKTLFKIVPILLMGVSLSACSLVNNIPGLSNGSSTTKFESYKREVTLNQFEDELQQKLKDSPYMEENFRLGDAVLEASASAKVSQKIVNDTYSKKNRSEVSAKASASAKLSYDKDNESIALTMKDEMSGKYDNAVAGEGSASQKASLNYLMQKDGRQYALVNKDDKTYMNFNMDEDMSLNELLSYGVQGAIGSIVSMLPAEGSSESYDLPSGLSLKYYWDSDVFTVVAKADNYHEDLVDRTYRYDYSTNQYYYDTQTYGEIKVNGEAKIQLKVAKVVKFRASFSGTIEGRFYEDHNSILGGMISISDLLTSSCVAHDVETIKIEASAGVNFQQKSVSNKTVDLTTYKRLIAE